MTIKSFFKYTDKYLTAEYLVLSVCILYFFNTVIKIELYHIAAFIVSVITVYTLTDLKNEDVNDINTTLEYKLITLSDVNTEYLHLDADIINIFYYIKNILSIYNLEAYNKALEHANNVLKIKKFMDIKICGSPKVPDYTANLQSYEIKEDTVCNKNAKNSYENFRKAEKEVKKCMNTLHTFIFTIPSNPEYHLIHEKIMKKVHIYLKRNLDKMKQVSDDTITNDGINKNTKFINDYDLQKPIVKYKNYATGLYNRY